MRIPDHPVGLGVGLALSATIDGRTGWSPCERRDTRIVGERRVRLDREWLTTAARVEIEVRYETRPEIVCGTPKEERVIHVDVATGKVASPVIGR